MTTIRTLWFLAGLFTFALVAISLMTVAPGGETAIEVVMIVFLSLAVLCALGAVLLHRLRRRRPNAAVFTSKLVSRLVGTAAVFLALVVLLGVVG
jgi:uncharacterized membrane protein YbhN (UPF0104 family)